MTEHADPKPPAAAATIAAAADAHLAAFIDAQAGAESLLDACRYALLGGGKRLRPVLAWMSAEAAGGGTAADLELLGRASLPAGAAIELIHAFSLVHDDLPALDDDDLRRGRPTLHRHTNEAMAILAGDAMTVLAFEALRPVEPLALRAMLIEELSRGTLDMIHGQVWDTLGGFPASCADDRAKLELIHRNKTGALLRASSRMGAMLGMAAAGIEGEEHDERLALITRHAELIGLLFQVVDDLLDVEQSAEHIGKATGKDAAAGKLTYPGIVGVAESRRIAADLEARALDTLAPLGDAAKDLIELTRYMAVRTK